MPSRTQAIAARFLPATLLVGLAVYAVVGPGGFRDYLLLSEQAAASRAEWTALEKESDRLLLDVQQMETDPIHLERKVADKLGLARAGSTLYYFDEDDAVVIRTHTP